MTPVEIARVHVARATPWMHQARGPYALDCVGLIVVAFAAYGLQDRTTYERNPHDGMLERLVAEQFGPPIPRNQMQAGDVVLMSESRKIRHVGILGDHPRGGLTLIHTWNGGDKCVIEQSLDDKLAKRIKVVHRMTAR